jgi:membrane associated rhomboid family serine protease
VPLSDRDYMKNPSPPPGRTRRSGGFEALALNPVLLLIVINFAFYIASLINSDIIARLGLIPLLFTERPWTILTAMFVHEGFWHIFGNMITLYFFGTFLARLIGNNWFLLLYFVGGIAGNALYLWLGQPVSLVIGASGAVYAIAGALVVMMPKLPVRLYFILPLPLWAVVLVFFVLWSFIPGVAWQAHIGGLAVGLIAGFFFRRRIRYNFYR